MEKKTNNYWAERAEALEKASHDRGASYFAELEKQYSKASVSVQDDINKWYARFAKNNEISLQEAKKMLTKRELEEFKWSVQDYIKKGRENGTSGQWSKQLENASARVHISRLDAIKMQMQNHVEVLYGNELDDVSKLMEEIYTSGYYHTAFELQKGFNIGYSLMKLNTDQIEKVISKPWAGDGSNFSDRIWKQKSQLVSELHNNLTQAIIRGKSPFEVTEAISKRFNVSKNQAGRLVMTESAFFAEQSSKDAYKELGVEKYQILATLDEHTSEICQDLDGEVFKMNEYEVGVTAPPFHCYCRSTIVPYFDDKFELGTERASRGLDGQTEYVPSNMKYNDWYKKYVANSTESSRMKVGSPINTRNNSKGRPTAITQFDVDLNNRQTKLLNELPKYDSQVIVNKDEVSMKDLSALTAKENCEFAMFTKESSRLIIRGNNSSVNIDVEKAKELHKQGYKWSGHTHPGTDRNCLIASKGDYKILETFNQKQSVIYNSLGQYLTFSLVEE